MMVFGGTFSNGCATCKKRKIKCDEFKPYCRRCLMIRKRCPGYKICWAKRFKNENQRIHNRVQTEKSCAPKPLAAQKAILDRNCRSTSPPVSYLHPFQLPEFNQLLRLDVSRPRLSADPTAIQVFYKDYIIFPDGDSEPGWLSFLPKLYVRSKDDSALRFAVKAVADAHAGNKSSSSRLMFAAQESYGIALGMVKEDLLRLSRAVKNDTVTAVFLLGLYEYIAGNDKQAFWHSHGQGLRLLLGLRNPDHVPIPREMELYEMVLCQMQRENLELRRQPTPEESILVGFLDGSPAGQMVSTLHKCSQTVATAQAALSKLDESPDNYMSLLKASHAACLFDAELRRVSSLLSVDLQTTLDSSLPALHINPESWKMRVWNMYRSSRIILNETILQCTTKLRQSCLQSSDIANLHDNAISIIQQMTEEIFSTVSYFIGSLDHQKPSAAAGRNSKSIFGYFLLWPLHVIRCHSMHDEQKHRAQQVLVFIGNEFGLKHALEIAQMAC